MKTGQMNTPHSYFSTRQSKLLTLGASIAGLALLFVFDGMFDVFTMQIFKLCAINIILALSLNLINGFTGLFSLGPRRVHGSRRLYLRHPYHVTRAERGQLRPAADRSLARAGAYPVRARPCCSVASLPASSAGCWVWLRCACVTTTSRSPRSAFRRSSASF